MARSVDLQGPRGGFGCFRRYWEALGAEEEWAWNLEELVDGGQRQAVLVRAASRGTTSGAPHEHLWGYVVEARDGRIVYFRAYYHASEALQALGLQE